MHRRLGISWGDSVGGFDCSGKAPDDGKAAFVFGIHALKQRLNLLIRQRHGWAGE
jgi:hypothetical protein